MCRLFGMHAGRTPARATMWLLTDPDSLAQQSRREADGTGIGVFGPGGAPIVDKQPIAAYEDKAFATEARELESRTFVAHVRYASTGANTLVNTHPFEQDGRLLAHNGVLQGLDVLEARLRELGVMGLVRGQTDSERMFALITAEARRNGGDVGAAIVTALTWIIENIPLYAANIVLTTPSELWAVRYPDTHPLYVLERPSREGGDQNAPHPARLEARTRRISVRSDTLAERGSVIVATEPMDSDPGWRQMGAGEVAHVGEDLHVHSSAPLPPRPAHPLSLKDLEPRAASSQQSSAARG
ncbi:class II glutamine amidotransferase [Cellulomonas chengniuliangii]|uniref:Class II glutamine amidotransferase n=1 Tax=Cellulomonas chengniuliangii TaxID=2968084 RepID=A0ABY5L540_9CELL|nr:class II glutamine amidotransferase [Cellulomonas chengniuliangii]MCC2307514.1 class II glutamine amidotransferase [Cellulomonas chengniuliangii]MCC2318626.1 class II glutamine amidotransferase [Cellulomonas chengniuliangii]UUI75713.1 class II glutamine amidotransferase [Cellulomonas chengniuliangii]